MSNRRRRGFAVPARLQESAPASAPAPPVEPVVEVDSPKPGSDRKLRDYWIRGEGAAKIRWGEPNDFDRCVRHLGKYVADPKGLCAEYHHEALGVWPGREQPKKEAATGTDTGPVEAAADKPTAVRIAEAATLAPSPVGARRFRARLIAGDVQGSSGYYPASTLRESAPVFRAGLPVYLDHPGLSEEADRPERSVRDLAGKLLTEARYQGDGLYADIEVYPHWAPVIEAMRDDIGMSIRASGMAEHGKPDGQRGPLVTAITAAESVDFVTAAGAGGKIVALLESARLAESTTDVTRTALADALQDRYAGPNTYVWVRDFDPDAGLVWFDVSAGGDCDCWQMAYTITAAAAPVVTLTGEATQVMPQTTYAPVADPDDPGEQPGDDAAAAATESATAEAHRAEPAPATQTPVGAPPPVTPITEGMPSMSGAQNSGSAPGAQAGHTPADANAAPDIVVSEARRQVAEMRLDEAVKTAETLRAQLTEAQQKTAIAEARAEKAETDLRQVRAAEAARTAVAAELAKSDLPAFAHAKVTEAVTRNVALDDKGHADTTALATAITAAVEAERRYIAEAQQAAGAGTVTGLGAGTTSFTEADADAWEKTTAARLARLAGTNGKAA